MHNLIVHLKGGREVIPVMIKHQVLTTVHHSSRTIPWPTCIKSVTSRLEKNINLVCSYQYWLLSWPLQNYRSVFVECSWSFGKANLNSNPMQEPQSSCAWVDELRFEKTQETRACSKSLLFLPAANMCHSQQTCLAAGSKQLVKTTRELIS